MNQKAASYYSSRIQSIERELSSLNKLFTYLFTLRLLSFCAIVGFLIAYTVWQSAVWLPFASIFFVLFFLFVVQIDLRFVKKKKLLENRLKINENELKYLVHNYNEFNAGDEFKSLNTHLAEDFDLFGEHSLYQYLNRASTKAGQHFFAAQLCQWDNKAEIIKSKQLAIEELTNKEMFLEDFQSMGLDNEEAGNEQHNLLAWLNKTDIRIDKFKWLLVTYPILFALWVALMAIGFLSIESIVILLAFAGWIVMRHVRLVNSAHQQLGNIAKAVAKYEKLIFLIEQERFTTPFLVENQGLLVNDNVKDGDALKSLYKLLNTFDYRYNMVVGFLLNLIFLFDLQMLYRLEVWKRIHREMLPKWFEALRTLDAMIGFARYNMNNKEQVIFPEIKDENFVFEAHEMGHPLIPSEIRVSNDILFEGQPKVVVVTGANMAGKSTFLRTLAVNMILAVNGAPVCARTFRFSPCDIMSSIQIRDSLSHKASYFYSELLRLSEIINHVNGKPKTLVILDEILRGTNTRDKQAGALGLLKKMISMNAIVVIATHDLTIGELESSFPHIVSNYCFEVELEGDELVFDYKLKPGISKKLNASFLMKKMGVIE